MPRYRVNMVTVMSHSVEVEAENEDEALELGFDQAPTAAWDWPDIGDWTTSSELFPQFNKPEDDVELLED